MQGHTLFQKHTNLKQIPLLKKIYNVLLRMVSNIHAMIVLQRYGTDNHIQNQTHRHSMNKHMRLRIEHPVNLQKWIPKEQHFETIEDYEPEAELL